MTTHRALHLALAASLLAAPAFAQTKATSINIPHETFKLANGLTVILAPDHTVPQVAVDIWYHVGSKNELTGHTGFAHMFEHTMFTGSEHVPYGMHDRLTEGVSGIPNNASTSNDVTNYYDVVPPNYLESAMWLESDRMGFLLEKLDETKFKAQRDIVQNERRQSVDNRPYGRSFELLDYGLFPESNQYSWPVVGYMTDLQKATVQDVKDFFNIYYSPSNASLAIVGDFEPAQAKAYIHKYFDDIKAGTKITRPTVVAPVLSAEKRLTFEDRVQIPRLFMSWVSVGDDNDDSHALDLMGRILAGSRTSRLSKVLVYDRQTAAAVSAGNDGNENGGKFIIQITPRPGNSLSSLEVAADSILARFRLEGPTADELERAKAGREFAFVSQLQSNLGKANILNDGQVFHGDASYYRKDYAELKAVTADDVKRVANKYLGSGRVVLSIVPLNKAEQAARADASTRVTVAADGGHYVMEKK